MDLLNQHRGLIMNTGKYKKLYQYILNHSKQDKVWFVVNEFIY